MNFLSQHKITHSLWLQDNHKAYVAASMMKRSQDHQHKPIW